MFRDFFKSSEKAPPTPEEQAQIEFRADRAAFFHAIAKQDIPIINTTIKKYGDEALNWEKSGQTPIHYALYKKKLSSFTALLDHGANTRQKVKTEGEYYTAYLNVLEHALYRGRDKFVYALLQRRDNVDYRPVPYTPDAMIDMIKRADKIRAAYLADHPEAKNSPAPRPQQPPQVSKPAAANDDEKDEIRFLRKRISSLEKDLRQALARIEKLENPETDVQLDKPHYPPAQTKPKPKR